MSRQAPQAIPQETISIKTSADQNSCLLHASLMPIFAYYSLGDKCPEAHKPTQKYVMDMLTRTDLIRHMPKKEKVLQDPQAAIIKFTQGFFRDYFVDIIKVIFPHFTGHIFFRFYAAHSSATGVL
ncbi:hypothetical protein [Candidiatus Paracoxiella cheracis]|uniref:hypothetical protein n=1 Tax=Candidiatus Paracoxiella cheracis TaxID=3405120 RepID=UPI003BF49EE5